MIYRSLVFCALFASLGCGQQKSKEAAPPAEIERILGEEGLDDDDEKADPGSSADTRPDTGNGTGKKPDDKEPPADETAEFLDLSKIEELIYRYKEGNAFQEVIATFEGSKCRFQTASGVNEASLFQCLALKTALSNLKTVPYVPGSSCDAEVEQVIVTADGLKQALLTQSESAPANCDIPQLPAEAVTLLDQVLEYLPN